MRSLRGAFGVGEKRRADAVVGAELLDDNSHLRDWPQAKRGIPYGPCEEEDGGAPVHAKNSTVAVTQTIKHG